MIPYRSFFILQRDGKSFLIIDNDKIPITLETTLTKAKHFIDCIVDGVPEVSDL